MGIQGGNGWRGWFRVKLGSMYFVDPELWEVFPEYCHVGGHKPVGTMKRMRADDEVGKDTAWALRYGSSTAVSVLRVTQTCFSPNRF